MMRHGLWRLLCFGFILGITGCQGEVDLTIPGKSSETQGLISEPVNPASETIGEAPGGGKVVTAEEALKSEPELENVESSEDKPGAVAVKYDY